MTIQLNGKDYEVAEPTSHIGHLLVELKLDGQPVLVEHNGTAIFPRDFDTVRLQPDDKVELIRVVAGG